METLFKQPCIFICGKWSIHASELNYCIEKKMNGLNSTVSPVADPLPSVVAKETETGMLRIPLSSAHTVTGLDLSTMENSSCSKPMFTTGGREREREEERERERERGKSHFTV